MCVSPKIFKYGNENHLKIPKNWPFPQVEPHVTFPRGELSEKINWASQENGSAFDKILLPEYQSHDIQNPAFLSLGSITYLNLIVTPSCRNAGFSAKSLAKFCENE